MTGDSKEIAVLLSTMSGKGRARVVEEAQASVEGMFRAAGRAASVSLVSNADSLRRAVRDAVSAKADAVVVGAGDGIVSVAAGILSRGDVPLGVLPLGTLNHFARDLGIPLGLEEAAGVILAGHTGRIDVGEVNGRVFINNSSVGLYPRILRMRRRYPARGVRKWLIAAWATLQTLKRHGRLAVRVRADRQDLVRRTPLVLVGNNEYRMEGIDALSRPSLTGGRLAIYIVKTRRASEFLRMVWGMFLGRRDAGLLDMLRTEAASVAVAPSDSRFPIPHSRLSVAIDGEVEVLSSPLEYRIVPGALRVFVPRPEPLDEPRS